jgi:hypothetical protein
MGGLSILSVCRFVVVMLVCTVPFVSLCRLAYSYLPHSVLLQTSVNYSRIKESFPTLAVTVNVTLWMALLSLLGAQATVAFVGVESVLYFPFFTSLNVWVLLSQTLTAIFWIRQSPKDHVIKRFSHIVVVTLFTVFAITSVTFLVLQNLSGQEVENVYMYRKLGALASAVWFALSVLCEMVEIRAITSILKEADDSATDKAGLIFLRRVRLFLIIQCSMSLAFTVLSFCLPADQANVVVDEITRTVGGVFYMLLCLNTWWLFYHPINVFMALVNTSVLQEQQRKRKSKKVTLIHKHNTSAENKEKMDMNLPVEKAFDADADADAGVVVAVHSEDKEVKKFFKSTQVAPDDESPDPPSAH